MGISVKEPSISISAISSLKTFLGFEIIYGFWDILNYLGATFKMSYTKTADKSEKKRCKVFVLSPIN